MAERNPIFKAKTDNQIIAYIEDTEVFDLMGTKRCNYNPITGNLVELNGRRIIGHVSLTGYFIGLSSMADDLFSGRTECRATVLLPNQSNAASSAEQPSASPSLNGSIDEHAALDNVAVSLATIKPNEAGAVAETALSSDAERALEMIRITLATRSFDLKH
jgi:hypothetical protein